MFMSPLNFRRFSHISRLVIPLRAWCAVFGFAAVGSSFGKISYNFEVRPILASKCFSCHGSDAKDRKGDLRLDLEAAAKEKAIKPGNPDASELVKRLLSTDEDEIMPPPEKHERLTDAQVNVLRQWITEGAEYEQHWAFVPPAAPPAASVGSIDEIISARHAAKGLKPTGPADKAEWIRRASLVLTGLVPTLAEVDAFLADVSPQAKENAVDRLLASKHYGERMAAVWLDAARYADTFGRHEDQDNNMFPWRDWVIQAFNKNMPYDQFLTWQLAGDLLPHATQEQRIATGFHRLAVMTNEAGSNPEENRWMQIFDRVQVTSTALLGLTMECAQCHDHKYDPISMKDYYQMAAFFDKGDEFGLFARYCNGTPPPTTYVYAAGQEAEHQQHFAAIRKAEEHLKMVREQAQERFKAWCVENAPPLRASGWAGAFKPQTKGSETTKPSRKPAFLPQPELAVSFDAIDGKEQDFHISTTPPLRTPGKSGMRTVDGVVGKAVAFPDVVGNSCQFPPDLCYYRKFSPFTFAFWLQQEKAPERGAILHRCRAGVDATHRGFEFTFWEGKLTASLAHFYPGDAIRIQALEKMDFPQWTHLSFTYDGSGRAAGMKLYVNGKLLPTKVIRDSLKRDIDYRVEWHDSSVQQVADGTDTRPQLTLGNRSNDTGLLNAAIDELRAYDRELSPVEIGVLSGKVSTDSDEPWFDWYIREIDAEGVQAHAALTKARKDETEFNIGLKDMMVMEDSATAARVTPILNRGDFRSPTTPVEPGAPAALNPLPAGAPRNRLGLAQWLVAAENPLTARVQVNRLWALFFGKGLVATPQDFGLQGEVPAIPELLDSLARKFQASGWDMKALCKEIAISEAFGRNSLATEAATLQADPQNAYLTRGPRFRLSAEQLRDSVLKASGLLNDTVGGPSVKPYQPAGLWEDTATQHSYEQDKGPGLYRRSLYTFWRRTCPPPTMSVFDAPTREFCLVQRTTTLTPLQVLALWNDTGYLEAARVLAEQMVEKFPHPAEDPLRVTTAFRILTSKLPSAGQVKALTELLLTGRAEYTANAASATALLGQTGESTLKAQLPPHEVAATLMIVRAIYNAEPFVNCY